MKLTLFLISLLVLVTLAMPEDNYNRRNTQNQQYGNGNGNMNNYGDVNGNGYGNNEVGMTYHASRMDDFESSGMTEEEYTDAIANKMVTGIIAQMLENVRHTHIDSYDLEDGGELTHIEITVSPPSPGNVDYKADSKDSSMQVSVHDLGVKVTADVDMYYGTILGELTVDIKGIDLNLHALPQIVNGVPTTNIIYHMNLHDADIAFNINILEDKHDMPEDVQEGYVPLAAFLGDNSMKLAAKDIVHKTFKRNVEDVAQKYFDSMSTSYKISRETDHNVSFYLNKI
jgi:hypothetical protein